MGPAGADLHLFYTLGETDARAKWLQRGTFHRFIRLPTDYREHFVIDLVTHDTVEVCRDSLKGQMQTADLWDGYFMPVVGRQAVTWKPAPQTVGYR